MHPQPNSVVSGFVAAAMLSLCATPAVTQDSEAAPPPESAPLFADHGLLEFELHGPWDQIKRDREDGAEERPAILRIGDGEPIELEVRTRGNFRLKRSTCPAFPPIRLDFPRSDVAGTLFHDQDKLKLVTHCRSRDGDEQNVLQEYLAYRVLQELTDRSFRVRLARITYVDVDKPGDDAVTKLAFIIEDEEQLAARLGGEILEVPAVHPTDYDRDGMLLVALFEYAVGNTDWSLVHLHNVVLFRDSGMQAFPIPYDFDWTGLVDAPYAEPDETLSMRDVRTRLYRGYCVEGLDYMGVAAHIRAKRDAILGLPDQIPGMTDRVRRNSREYLQEFFDLLDNPDRFRGRVVDRCRPLN